MSEAMTTTELFALFDVPREQIRWQPSADSSEYLELVTYLVARSNRERP